MSRLTGPDLPWEGHIPEPAKIPGMVHFMAAVWDNERGWLTTRTSVIHRETMIERDDLPEIMAHEARVAARALQMVWHERRDDECASN